MPIEPSDGEIIVGGHGFELRFDRASGLRARLTAGEILADLLVPSSCHAGGSPDYSFDVSSPRIVPHEAASAVVVSSASTIWRRKEYLFASFGDVVEHWLRVQGEGWIDDCEFFQGFVGEPRAAGQDRPWIQPRYEGASFGRVRSRGRFSSYFNPEPNGLRLQRLPAEESSTIGVRSDKSRLRGNWFFTPGPFCYVLPTSDGRWVALGLAVKPGENSFVEYQYAGGNGFGLNVHYEGRVFADGEWESPHLTIMVASDEYAALDKYCAYLRQRGLVPVEGGRHFDWWREPIFCGWGAQCHLSKVEGNLRAPQDYATQVHYVAFLEELERRGLSPGTVIVDDKWQSTYGDPLPDPTKWPDLKSFVAQQHEDGRHVLLWLKAWDAEGIPPEECLIDASGRLPRVDPSNAAYEKRLRQRIRELLVAFDADGFKVDITADHPASTVQPAATGLWGVELLRRLLWIIHDEAKRAKEDALVIAHTVNPYFADLVDMARLNDIAIISPADGYAASMAHRQRVARASSPRWLIDTDNWPSPTLAAWLEYVCLQPDLGVPSLYYVSHVDESGEEIDPAATGVLAGTWAEYRRKDPWAAGLVRPGPAQGPN